ncbi:sugar ABC transporter substrate-binding protein [Conexibacter woesei]|uniref:Periplasmic binding protein/LacI transcriptional regulator n=1 Tax=Conexibacter woesei (strain DSM 14684 / CCUG 47730 / CIP 108061 / JCM 11494 / NBRC 100937 / ID131577) TaxID=469383 RepID=D3EZ16_CONWI|nr:sugar ABC transporter substrate-binding protein [Conexibacter woesei]ADB49890.1 periplasmic binding protein/LacI transcriptional regulator [Conexibacter woesei DSM 14684]
MRATALLATVVAAAVTLLAGCGSDSDGGSGSTSGGGGGDDVRVYVLLPSLESDSYVQESRGAEEAAKQIDGAEVKVDAGASRGEATNLIAKIDSAVTKGYDVIAVNPGAVGAELAPALSRAIAADVDVVAFDQNVPDLDDLSAYVGYDGYQAGLLRGRYLTKALPDGGAVGMIDCFKENPLTAAINRGQLAGMEGSRLRVVSELEAQCDPAKARTAAENMLTAHPEMRGLLAGTDIAAMAALPVVESFGKPLVVVGGDGQQDALRVIAEGGGIQATTLFPFAELGAEAVRTAVAVGRGEQVDAEVMVEPTLIDRANVEKFLG